MLPQGVVSHSQAAAQAQLPQETPAALGNVLNDAALQKQPR